MLSTRQRSRARTHPTTRLALAAAACLACLAGPAAAQSRTDTLAISGQSAAGAGAGATFTGFAKPVLNDAGQAAFIAGMAGGTSNGGLYRSSAGGKPVAIALQGQSAAGAGAGKFLSFSLGAPLNEAGQIAFLARITDGTGSEGVYRSGSDGVLTALAVQGQSAPASGGSTFFDFFNPVLNEAGQTAFLSNLVGGGSTQGIYLRSSGGTPTALALRGQGAPGAGSGTFSDLFTPVLNASGQTAFMAVINGGTSPRAIYRSSGSTLTPIAMQGQSAAGAGAGLFSGFSSPTLNDAGQTAFLGFIAGGSSTQGVYRSGSGNTPTAIALQGQGAAGAGTGTFSGFSAPLLNAAGQTAFSATITGGSSTQGIYRSSSGSALTAIALQGQSAPGAGAGTFSDVFSPVLNDGGQTAFTADIVGGTSAGGFYVGDGRDTVVVQLQGASLANKTVSSLQMATGGFNRHGQVAYLATFTDGTSGNFLFTPALRWRNTTSGSWADAANWTLALNPAHVHDVTLDPANSLTVTGPSNTVALHSLQVGTGAGVATLAMAGGRIDAESVRIGAQGVLSGTGSFGSLVSNQGVLQAERLQLLGGLDNQGTVRGASGLGSRLDTNVNNTSTGRVRVDSGETLQLFGKAHLNAGVVEVNGGRLETSGSFTNAKAATVDLKNATVVAEGAWRNDAGARLMLNEARLTTTAGLNNAGQVQITSGSSEFFGKVVNEAGGQILLSGQGTTTFYDNVEAQKSSELRVSTGATAVFFGAVQQRSGAVFSGSGLKYYEGGFSVGNSPGLASDGGDVSFGLGNTYLAELGGTTAGSGFDHYSVAGTLTLGGTLQIVSWDGFTGQVGQSFDLFDWGQLQGQFGQVDASGLQLAEGTRLDLSRLYVDGTVSVTAVPEPGTWALMLSGAGLLVWRRRVAR
ncbi:MAG: choice-of-anchor tandem repeat NxxGxxAF-containing protein [Rubrivivax sp.]|jgi:hypothetical protein